jgi:CheY-like chemotaxis protein
LGQAPERDADVLQQTQIPTVLVVDDEPIVLSVVRAALARDHKVLEAGSALKALEVSERFAGSIDVLVSDHHLKDASGQELVGKIRAARPGIQVLYFSGYGRDHSSNESLPADAEFLEKPFRTGDLRAAIVRVLGSRQSGAGEQVEPRGIDDCNPRCMEKLRDQVTQSRSLFGRIITVSKLWNAGKNRYEHRLSAEYGIEEVDLVLRMLHQEAMVAWLSYSLRQQKADVSIYLDGMKNPALEIPRLGSLGMAALPRSAKEPERQLFQSEMSAIQMMLECE